jgi:hypothetical protein
MAPSVLNATRTAATVQISRGRAVGSQLMLADVVPPSDPAWSRQFLEVVEQHLDASPEVVALHLLRGDADVTARKGVTEEGSFFAEATSEWILVVEGEGELHAATTRLLTDAGVATADSTANRDYELLYELTV